MEALKKAGLLVIPVTGRPAGWCDLIARFWPVDAVVGENGAFWMWHDDQGAASCAPASSSPTPSAPTAAAGWRRCAPTCCARCRAPASPRTSPIALADLAIDFCEDVPPLPRADIERIVAIFERHGAHAKVSSIHVNGWFGDYDKLTTSRTDDGRAVRRRSRARRRRATSSPAIRPTTRRCSAFFPMAWAWPTCVTSPMPCRICRAGSRRPASGAGFVELAQALIAARS